MSRVIGLYVVYILAAMSPGPATLYVMRTALESRRLGLRGAWGISTATTTWFALATLGFSAVLSRAPGVITAIRVVGGLYFLYMAWRLARAALRTSKSEKTTPLHPHDGKAAYVRGFVTNVSNPGTVVFFTSLLGMHRIHELPLPERASVYLGIPLLSLTWYSTLAFLFSNAALARAYTRLQRPLDVILALVFTLLGIDLLMK